MDNVLQEIAPHITKEHLIVSIAAGYTIERIEKFIGKDKRLIRCMPNTPCKIGAGATVYCLNDQANDNDADSVELLFNSVGLACRVKENMLDAVTGVSGSGPAYVYMFIEAMADGGVKMGLPRDVA